MRYRLRGAGLWNENRQTMFSNKEAEEDVFLSQLAVIFLISNLNHWWKLWCSYISYYQTIYVPLTQVIDSTAGFQGASSTFIPRKQRRTNRKRSAEAFQLLVQQDAAYFMDIIFEYQKLVLWLFVHLFNVLDSIHRTCVIWQDGVRLQSHMLLVCC